MDANQIEKLKALALAAGDWTPPEPWEDDRNYSDREIRGLEFCAAANPAAVLELIAEVERLRAAPVAGTVKDSGWIDLKKDKPMDWQRVLVALDSGAVVEGYWGSAGWHWGETDEPQDGDANAAYWMPWPESPVAAMEATKAGKDNA